MEHDICSALIWMQIYCTSLHFPRWIDPCSGLPGFGRCQESLESKVCQAREAFLGHGELPLQNVWVLSCFVEIPKAMLFEEPWGLGLSYMRFIAQYMLNSHLFIVDLTSFFDWGWLSCSIVSKVSRWRMRCCNSDSWTFSGGSRSSCACHSVFRCWKGSNVNMNMRYGIAVWKWTTRQWSHVFWSFAAGTSQVLSWCSVLSWTSFTLWHPTERNSPLGTLFCFNSKALRPPQAVPSAGDCKQKLGFLNYWDRTTWSWIRWG